MRSPLGAVLDLVPRPRNQTPVPMVGRSTGRLGLGALFGQPRDTQAYMAAMGSVGTLFSIVHRTSNATSQVNWRLWSKAKSGKKEDRTEVTSHAALDLWNRPNPHMTRQELIEAGQQHVDLVGEGPIVIGRHPAARSLPLELWPVRPDRIRPVPSPTDYLLGWVYISPDGEEVPLGLDELKLLRMPNPLDPYRGMGPVQTILTDLDSVRYSAEWNRNFFLNSAEPGGIIQVDRHLSQTEFDEMVDRWREQHQGVAQAHRVAVIEEATWVDRKMTQRDMQFAELRDVSRDVIREAFGMPKFAVGDVQDVNRATAEASKAWFAEMLTVPRLERWKGFLNNDLLPMFGPTAAGLEFDYDDPVPPNAEAINAERTSKSASALALVNAGYTGDSVVEALDLPSTLVWEKPQPPAPAPVPPPSVPPADAVPVDRLLDALRGGRPPVPRNAPQPAPQAPPEGTPAQLPPDQLPDVSHARTALEAALAALLVSWAAITATQKANLVAAIVALARDGQLADLATVPVDSSDAAQALLHSMQQLAAIAGRHVVTEADQQGVTLTAGTVAASDLEQVADLTAALLADELRTVAARAAMRANGPDATPEHIGTAVQEALDGVSDASARQQLGAALHGSINAARVATLRVGPVGAVYASEQNDAHVCAPCAAVNGKWLCTTDDLAPLALTYPEGAFGGYLYCLGRERCRGTVVGVWRPGTVDNSPAALLAATRPGSPPVGFNPEQPRDPNGKWGDGLPDVIVEKALKFGESTMHVEFHDHREVTLRDDANGRATRFTAKTLVGRGETDRRKKGLNLRGRIYEEIDMPVGHRTSWLSDWGLEKVADATPDNTPTWGEEDDTEDLATIALHLGLPDGQDVGQDKENLFRGPGLQTTIRDALAQIDTVDSLMSRVVRTDTGSSGRVDLFPDGRDIVIRPGGAGAPQWRMSMKDYRALEKALAGVYDFDNQPDGVTTQTREVTTAIGTFTVQGWRNADNKVTKLSIQPHWQDYELAADADHASGFVVDFGRPVGR